MAPRVARLALVEGQTVTLMRSGFEVMDAWPKLVKLTEDGEMLGDDREVERLMTAVDVVVRVM